MQKESVRKILIVSIYAIAMGFLEAAVVVYLRKLYYVNGFDFPLKGFIEPSVLSVEWIREFFTVVMLVTIGLLAGKKFYEKFAYFVYAFAIWDIFYYIFLKLSLNWPSSLLTWDLLFLIPWPWIGPVIAPLICTVLMIVMTFIIIRFYDKGKKVSINWKEWTLMIVGVILVLYTWMYDYGKLIFNGGYAKDFFSLTGNNDFYIAVSNLIPQTYNWPVFILGVAFAAAGILLFYLRMRRK